MYLDLCNCFFFQDTSARYDALRFLAGDAALPNALCTPEVQQYLGNDYMLPAILMMTYSTVLYYSQTDDFLHYRKQLCGFFVTAC